jgi:hypothetical protein
VLQQRLVAWSPHQTYHKNIINPRFLRWGLPGAACCSWPTPLVLLSPWHLALPCLIALQASKHTMVKPFWDAPSKSNWQGEGTGRETGPELAQQANFRISEETHITTP